MSKRVFTVATAHLDTIWSWDFETTVREYVYNTIVDNMKLFKKYPSYRFNFEGAYRYELMEEYYPELFKDVEKSVSEGRWNVTGSAYENGDVNVPSPEALFRNILYGNNYFKKKFGKTSADIFLPDCFGFGWALPSIAHHAELKGYTTQKLTWGSAYGLPFDLGKWYGVDGNYIYASLKMHDYDFTFKKLRGWDLIEDKLKENEKFGLDMTAVFHGTGDRGGAPSEKSVAFLESEIKLNSQSDTEILSASPDEVFDALDELPKEKKDKLPVWNNELLMSTHAVGSYVSRSISKRWNRRGEELADMAERSAVCAYILGRDYPAQALETCWKRIIRHQFHDDLTGTSVQRAYRRVWNDYALSINQLIGEYSAASKYIADRLDASWTTGTAIVVNNPCEYKRNDVVEIIGDFEKPSYVARDKDGNTYPCQKTEAGLIFIAEMNSLSFKVFDICEGNAKSSGSLEVTEKGIENGNYSIKINDDGWVSSVIDKKTDKEILASPVRLALYDYDGSKDWPAWEIPNNEALGTPHYPKCERIEVIENGPVRASVKVEYACNKSKFVSVISLSENGEMPEFHNEIMWHEMATIAKQEFSLKAENELATFDLGLGAIQRPNRTEKLYEVPAQKWADLSDGEVNVSVISDSKYSWDKYNDNTIRLTVLHTPKHNYRIDSMQSMMDLGLNRYGFAITTHDKDDFAKTNRLAKNFHQKMPAFIVSKHSGEIGSDISFGELKNDNLSLRAMKKAENSDSIVLRFNELNNKPCEKAEFSFFGKINSASEIYASENEIGKAEVENNALTFDVGAYGVKSFALDVQRKAEEKPQQEALDLDGNVLAYSSNKDNNKSLLPVCNLSIPAELVKEEINIGGVNFKIDSGKKAIIAKGQKISLPENTKTVHLLCGSLGSDKTVKLGEDDVKVNSIFERYAGWDLYDYGETAFIKDGRVGYEFTHCHSDRGDEIAKSMLFWVVSVDTKENTLELPNDNILILAITADFNENECALATELFEKVEKRPFDFKMNKKELSQYRKYKRYSKMNDKGRYLSMFNK